MSKVTKLEQREEERHYTLNVMAKWFEDHDARYYPKTNKIRYTGSTPHGGTLRQTFLPSELVRVFKAMYITLPYYQYCTRESVIAIAQETNRFRLGKSWEV